MKKNNIHILVSIFIINLMVSSSFLLLDVKGSYLLIDPGYGPAPIIDGYINETLKEWDDAYKVSIDLYKNLSEPIAGLPVDVWVMQANDSNLYICLRFDLEPAFRSDKEFMALLITERRIDDSAEDVNISKDVVDAKFIQFSNLTEGEFTYEDYYVNDSVYYKDTKTNGNGAAILNGDTIVYEFMMPVNSSSDGNDVFLDYGEDYGFVIVYGKGTIYPDDFQNYNIVIIHINYPESPPPPGIGEIVRFVLSVIIFSGLGALFGLYTYKIIILKKRVERYK